MTRDNSSTDRALRARLTAMLLLPSLSDVVFATLLFLAAFGYLTQRLFDDGSVGWHIRSGQRIVRTASLPDSDPFSSASAGKSWYAWEWLFDVSAGAADTWRGLSGVALLAAVIIASTFSLAFRFTVERGAGVIAATLLLLLTLGVSMVHLLARPHIATWLLAVLFFQVLDSAERAPQTRRNLIWLPLLMAVWVNVHGGFVLGFTLWAFFLASAVIRYFNSIKVEQYALFRWISVLCLTGIGMLAMSLVNPYGYKLHAHVMGYLTNSYFMNHIDEFRSPDFHGGAQQAFIVLLLITILALTRSSRRVTLSQLMVVLFAIGSGLYATRNLPVSALWLMMIVGPLLSDGAYEWLPRLRAFDQRMRRRELSPRLQVWPVLAVVAALLICAKPGLVAEAKFSSTRFPAGAVDFLSRERVEEPVFVPDSWGGYVIYRLYPQAKVVFDDRHDLLGQAAVEQYLQIVGAQPGWQQALAARDVNWMAVPSRSSLASAASLSPEWTQVYDDHVATVFHRAGK